MDDLEIKSLLKENLESLIKAGKDISRSGEELKAITEAIEITVKLLKTLSFTPSDSEGCYFAVEESTITSSKN